MVRFSYPWAQRAGLGGGLDLEGGGVFKPFPPKEYRKGYYI